MQKEKEIFINGNVPSSKNSKNVVRLKNGKTLIINSKTVEKYLKEHRHEWEQNKDKFLKLIENKKNPYKIEFTFIRGTKHKFDYNNISQIVQDLMVQCNWLEDDNANEIIPIFKEYLYDKEKPGVIIKVL